MSTKWNHAKVHTSLPLNFFALLFWSQGVIGGCRIYLHITHAINNLHIQAMAYHMNSLDIQSSGRGRGGPNYFKVGDLFYKICTSQYANFRKNVIRYVLWKVSNFDLIFYVIRTLHKKQGKVCDLPQDVSDETFFRKLAQRQVLVLY